MSLINKMLQDLEQRSGGNPVGNNIPHQVRSVSEHRGIHPAWWLVIVLSCVLVAVCLWFGKRLSQPAPAPQPVLSATTNANVAAPPVPPAAPIQPVAQASAPVSVISTAPVAPIAQQIQVPPEEHKPVVAKAAIVETVPFNLESAPIIPGSDVPAGATGNPVKTSGGKQKTEKKEVAEAKAEPVAKEEKPIATEVPVHHEHHEISNTPSALNKQVKELTPSQLAENAYRDAGVALQAGRLTDSIADLERALQYDAKHGAARQMLVGLLLQAHRDDDAVRRAEDGLAIDPSQVNLVMILARIQVQQGDVATALKTLKNGLPYAQDRADYRAFMAALFQRDKQYKEAVTNYIQALSKDPQNALWWMGLGISLQADNRMPEAKEAFTRARNTNALTPDLQAFVNQQIAQIH